MRTIALALALLATPLAAQDLAEGPMQRDPFTRGVGPAVLLTNHGFGFGGTARFPAGEHTSFIIEASIGAAKDEREQEFFTGPFGETVTLFKRNYFLMLPLNLGVEQRLWADAIEDNFRPFIQALAGPIVGYQWPYFEDFNGNGLRDPGEPKRAPLDLRGGDFRLGLGGSASFGAYLGDAYGSRLGIRIGYVAQYFIVPVDLLEPRSVIENPSRHFFGSPVISLHLLAW